jgi:hypothetical protein
VSARERGRKFVEVGDYLVPAKKTPTTPDRPRGVEMAGE